MIFSSSSEVYGEQIYEKIDEKHPLLGKNIYALSEEQVTAILDLRLQKLTAIGINEIETEIKKLSELISQYKKIINSRKELLKVISNELKNTKFQRSIYVVKNIRKGEKFSTTNIKRIRPGYSLSANKWSYIIGKKSKKTYKVGSRINIKDL